MDADLGKALQSGYWLLREGRLSEALSHARALVERRPGTAHALVLLAESQLAARDPEAALASIEQAIEASGGDPVLIFRKAALLQPMRRREEAIAMAVLAARALPHDGRMQWQVGDLLNHCNRPDLAVHYFSAARSLIGDQPPLLYDLAAARFFTGDFAQAEDNLDRMLALSPDAGHAFYLRSTLRRQTPERNHIEELRQRTVAPGIAAPDRQAAALFAMAKEQEDLGDHDGSFATLLQAARIKRGTLNYDVSSECAALQGLAQAYSADAMAGSAAGHPESGPIFIVGMPRTGTTLVERLLVQGGSVVSAGELLDFANLVGTMTQRLLDEGVAGPAAQASLQLDFAALGREYIRGAREAAQGSRVFIDKMPNNFLYCGLILKALPSAKIVHLARDPLDCCYAVFKTLFSSAYHFSYDLEELADYYVAYRRLMDHWHAVLPGAILDVSYEALVGDPVGQARSIFEWCGLDFDPDLLATTPKAGTFASASAAQVREPVHQRSVRASRRHRAGLSPLIDRLAAAGIRID